MIKKLFYTFFTRGKKNLIILTGGTLISQTIPFFLSPIIARLYTPEQFSTLELVLRISALFSMIATLRLDVAIPVPKESRKATDLLILAMISSSITSLFCFVTFYIFQNNIVDFLDSESFGNWLMYIPILIFFTGISQAGANMLLRMSKYNWMSISKILDSSVNNLLKIVLGILLSSSLVGLIFPNFLGIILMASMSLVILIKSGVFSGYSLNKNNLIDTFKEFQVFPKVNLPNALVDVLQIALVAIIISNFFGRAALGFYALKLRVLKTPTVVLGNAAGQLFYQTASKDYSNDIPIKPLFLKYIFYFSFFGLLIFTPFFLFGSQVFDFVFGSNWTLAGRLAQITSPWMFLNFIASALSFTPVILKKQKIVLIFNVINFALVISSWTFGFYIFNDLVNTVILVSIIESIYFLMVNIWYYKIISDDQKNH